MRAMLATSMARIKTRANPSHKRVESIFVQRAIILFAIFAELHNKTYCLSNVPPTVVFWRLESYQGLESLHDEW